MVHPKPLHYSSITEGTFRFYYSLCKQRDLEMQMGDRFVRIVKKWNEEGLEHFIRFDQVIAPNAGIHPKHSIQESHSGQVFLTFRAI